MRRVETWTYHDFTLISGTHGYKNTMVGVNTANSTGYMENLTASTSTFVFFGVLDEECDATSGIKTCRVNFLKERRVVYFGNQGSITNGTGRGHLCYAYTNQDVTLSGTNNSCVGMILDVDSVKGVAVDIDIKATATTTAPTISDFTNATHDHSNAANGGATLTSPTIVTPTIASFANAQHNHSNAAGGGANRLTSGSVLSFTGVTCSLTATNGSHYLVPATGTQASKIVVAATGTRGDSIEFTADSINNTQTVTYYSGTVAETTALTASKTHAARAVFDGTNWVFNYAIGP